MISRHPFDEKPREVFLRAILHKLEQGYYNVYCKVIVVLLQGIKRVITKGHQKVIPKV